MKIRILTSIALATLLPGGCRQVTSNSTASNWRISDIEKVIYTAPDVKAKSRIRFIEIDSPTRVKVYIGDFAPLSGGGQRITLILQDDGSWVVESVQSFDS